MEQNGGTIYKLTNWSDASKSWHVYDASFKKTKSSFHVNIDVFIYDTS